MNLVPVTTMNIVSNVIVRERTEVKLNNKDYNDYIEFFDLCLYRLAYLHSWYKLKGKSNVCTVTPVLGNLQEPQNTTGHYEKGLPSKFSNSAILWHFNVNDNVWHTDPDERLKKVISENTVRIQDMSHFYFNRDACTFESNQQQLNRFKPIYHMFKNAAKNIITFLENNPDVPLPEAVDCIVQEI